jgi:hypothetical protein
MVYLAGAPGVCWNGMAGYNSGSHVTEKAEGTVFHRAGWKRQVKLYTHTQRETRSRYRHVTADRKESRSGP